MLAVLQQEGKDFNLTHNEKFQNNKDGTTLTVALTGNKKPKAGHKVSSQQSKSMQTYTDINTVHMTNF